ncbi:MAG: hypothetical protein V4757_21525 [Pseudomonadota bacterium]
MSGAALFVAILLVTYVAYINLMRVDVVFYASIASALIAVGIFGIALFGLRFFAAFTVFEKTQQLVICGLVGYVFAISAPTVIDRSLSFYILEKLQQRGGGIQLAKFDHVFKVEYMREHRLLDIRLTEQAESGTLVIEGGCVKLTERGERLASFSRFFRKFLLPKKRLIRGEYTDQLVDPFSASEAAPDYACK